MARSVPPGRAGRCLGPRRRCPVQQARVHEPGACAHRRWLAVAYRPGKDPREEGDSRSGRWKPAAGNWQSKNWRTLEWNYRHSPHFDDFAPFLAGFYEESRWNLLVDVNIALCDFLRRQLRNRGGDAVELEPAAAPGTERAARRHGALLRLRRLPRRRRGGSRRYLEESCFAEAGSRAEVRRFPASGVSASAFPVSRPT